MEPAIDAGTAVPTGNEPAVEEVQKPSVEAKEVEAPGTQDTPETPTGDAEDPEKKEAEKVQKKNSISERLSKKTQQVNEAREREEAANRRAEAAEQRLKELQGGEAELKYPTLQDVDYDEDAHRKAVIDYHDKVAERANRRNSVENERLAKEEAQRELNEAVAAQWEERQAAFEVDHPDFREKVSSPTFVQANHVAAALKIDENGAAVAYHLAQNPH